MIQPYLAFLCGKASYFFISVFCRNNKANYMVGIKTQCSNDYNFVDEKMNMIKKNQQMNQFYFVGLYLCFQRNWNTRKQFYFISRHFFLILFVIVSNILILLLSARKIPYDDKYSCQTYTLSGRKADNLILVVLSLVKTNIDE